MKNTIKCPKCGHEFPASEGLMSHLREEASLGMEKKLRDEIENEKNLEVQDLKKSLQEKEERINDFRKQELDLRERSRKLEDKEKDIEIETQRRIDEEKKKIEEDTSRRLIDEHHLKDLEKDKKISDMEQLVEELKRKSQQGSMQTQGEVLELDFEQLLRDNFPNDVIEPVEKGVKGADVKQTVKSPKGFVCGVILWENKRTKAWSDSWITKLKDDLRREKANIPVIVSITLPKEIDKGLGPVNGVWVSNYTLAIPLAQLLRKNLLEVGFQKAISQHTGEKADMLYEYVTGHEFIQQVEAMVDVFKDMKGQITKERMAFEKIWQSREKQVDRLFNSTANIAGGIQGYVGQASFQIKGLELLELEQGNNEKNN